MSKSHIWCAHCKKPIGFVWGNPPLPDAFCYACEPSVTHQEEERQKSIAMYKRALLQAQGQTSA